MSPSPEPRSVRITRTFDAPIELVWRAWTEAEHVGRWMKCDPAATMSVEGWRPEVGATFRYRMAKEGVFDAVTTGRIVEAEPPRRFAYATDPNPDLGMPECRIAVELEEVEEGTRLTLTHSGLPSDDLCGIVQGGWTAGLAMLAELVEAGIDP